MDRDANAHILYLYVYTIYYIYMHITRRQFSVSNGGYNPSGQCDQHYYAFIPTQCSAQRQQHVCTHLYMQTRPIERNDVSFGSSTSYFVCVCFCVLCGVVRYLLRRRRRRGRCSRFMPSKGRTCERTFTADSQLFMVSWCVCVQCAQTAAYVCVQRRAF